MTPRLSTAVQELERAYARLNTTLFDAALPDNVVIAIQSRGRRSGVLGWYAPHSWRNGDDDGLHEITLTAETLARNDPADDLNVAETLIHEMAHHQAASEGVSDGRAPYHNREFARMASAAGLIVPETPLRGLGYAVTRLGERGHKALREIKFDFGLFNAVRLGRGKRPKQPTKMKKWSCACVVNIRCAVDLDARCNVCREPFEYNDH